MSSLARFSEFDRVTTELLRAEWKLTPSELPIAPKLIITPDLPKIIAHRLRLRINWINTATRRILQKAEASGRLELVHKTIVWYISRSSHSRLTRIVVPGVLMDSGLDR